MGRHRVQLAERIARLHLAERPAKFWFDTYISSARRFRDIVAKAGADVLIANHTNFDDIEAQAAGAGRATAGRAAPVRDRHGRGAALPHGRRGMRAGSRSAELGTKSEELRTERRTQNSERRTELGT